MIMSCRTIIMMAIPITGLYHSGIMDCGSVGGGGGSGGGGSGSVGGYDGMGGSLAYM